jgi:hypothetical protein
MGQLQEALAAAQWVSVAALVSSTVVQPAVAPAVATVVPTAFSRWQQQQYGLGAGVTVNVTAGGAFELVAASSPSEVALRLVIASSFTEAAAGGAHVRNLSDTQGGCMGWLGWALDRSLQEHFRRVDGASQLRELQPEAALHLEGRAPRGL